MPAIIIDRETLNNLFFINVEAGRFVWSNPPKQHPRLLGMEAGHSRNSHNDKRYWVIQINGIKYKRGRLMFFYVNGRFPSPCIDHINGDSLDDRILNLREATITQNAWNHKQHKRFYDLPMGVREMKNGKYQARISVNKAHIHLGTYPTIEDARSVYILKRKELYGDYSG